MTTENCYIVENPETGYRRFFYFTNETYNQTRDAAFRYANKNQTQKIPTTVFLSKAEKIWEYYPEPNLETETELQPKPEQKPKFVQKLNKNQPFQPDF